MKLQSIESMSVYDILTQHDFPHRFYAYFASQCAKDALSKDKNVDPRSKLAVDVAERFGNGEDFTQAYLQEVVADAAVQAAAYAAYAAANAAYAAAYAANSASAANAAANAAAYAAATYAAAHYKPLLLSLIQTRLTEFERIMIFGA